MGAVALRLSILSGQVLVAMRHHDAEVTCGRELNALRSDGVRMMQAGKDMESRVLLAR